ncbi:Xrs2p KNAG_0C04900 [Huiozyma naganishii CBS 8797]|uniref:FHA domain-containing protein n=1 Tax=Huiozyma naganishii (strain ATCC MYA-139 / BCRC 22969 / CBS 8797 / KCTC 17520 / NBRC 10181 / NCYC 3082 / Yp74L-3) TaxID=1071383 RepID=J7S682_HUIN7|nr:hypothetical protein KNAG_0C04900 [Kazachstania naganishii CBS 8797]CCK69591.1 hypothetical protein KNAG_0C04900 [Kazachstania naganishii CBS 8797]
MWILRYSYESEDHGTVYVSCCLQRSRNYSIGRSSKTNALVIKNDKSISRQHISFQWVSHDYVDIVNDGKLTYINDAFLKPKETTRISISASKETNIKVGSAPVIVNLVWEDVFIDMTPISDTGQSLKLIGIYPAGSTHGVNIEDAMKTLCIKIKEIKWPHQLIALIRGANRLYKADLVDLMAQQLVDSNENISSFDEIWNRTVDSGQYKEYPNFKVDRNSFRDFTIIYFDNNDSDISGVRSCVEFCGGTLLSFVNNESFEKYASTNETLHNVLLLRSERFQVSHPVYEILNKIDICSTGSFFKAVTENNVSTLVHRELFLRRYTDITQKEMRRPKEPVEDTAVPLKKRRLNRRKVQPLNPLEFFAGGDTATTTKQSSDDGLAATKAVDETEVSDKMHGSGDVLSNSTNNNQDTVATQGKISPILEMNALSAEVPKGDESSHVVEPDRTYEKDDCLPDNLEVNGMMKEPEPVIEKTRQSSINESLRTPKEPVAEMEDELEEVDEVDEPTHLKASREASKIVGPESLAPSRDTEVLRPRPAKPRNSSSLVETIQSVKDNETRRLQCTLTPVDPSELTDEAIADFSNMAIVEPTVNIVRKKPAMVTESSIRSDRPNFKKFMKVWPKARKGNDSLRNNAYLITRDYVPMKAYNRNEPKVFDEFENVTKAGILPDIIEPPIQPSQSLNHDTPPLLDDKAVSENELFVAEDSDEDEIPAEHARYTDTLPKEAARPRRRLLTTEEQADNSTTHLTSSGDESDSDDQGPRFKFSRRS